MLRKLGVPPDEGSSTRRGPKSGPSGAMCASTRSHWLPSEKEMAPLFTLHKADRPAGPPFGEKSMAKYLVLTYLKGGYPE